MVSIIKQQAEERRNRLMRVLTSIQGASAQSKPMDKEKTIGYFCLELGVSRRKMVEYLKTLESAGKIGFAGENLIIPAGEEIPDVSVLGHIQK